MMSSSLRNDQQINNTTINKACRFKLVMLGDYAVGKSSLMLRFAKGRFQEHQESTIGASFLTKTTILDKATVKFEIWDTYACGRYYTLAPIYCRGTHAAIIVYDITNTETFVKARNWIKVLRRQASENIVIALAGNKCDVDQHRAVPFEEALSYAEENDFIFLETSAKMDLNVNEIFLEIAKKLQTLDVEPSSTTKGLNLVQDSRVEKSGCCK